MQEDESILRPLAEVIEDWLDEGYTVTLTKQQGKIVADVSVGPLNRDDYENWRKKCKAIVIDRSNVPSDRRQTV